MLRLIRSLALVLSLALGWLMSPALARDVAGAEAVLPDPVEVTPRPALWKISDADTTIYLFGTIHALPAGVKWLNGPVEQALAASQELVTEIPETDPSTMQSAVMANAMLPAGQTLRGLLSTEDRAKYDAAMTSFGLPVQAFDRFEPWYAAVALTAMPLAREGYSAQNGVEETISAAALKQGKPRTGLETAQFQLKMFASLPLDVQKRYLHEVLDGLPTLDKELQDMIREWSAGNADKLAELMNDDEDDPKMVEVLLTGRNRTWSEWLKARMDKPGTVFVAVGAGHLAGKDSVLDMLDKAGVKPERVQ